MLNVLPDLIIGNSNKRFSGVTSTMLQVLLHQKKLTSLAVLGAHHLPSDVAVIKFWPLLSLLRASPEKSVVFHARRNDEMIQALALRFFGGSNLKIVFTSTAQRSHSQFSRWLMARMDGVITTCQGAGRYLREHREPDVMIPHGIDAERYQPSDLKKAELLRELQLPPGPAVGVFGRVRSSKGVELLIEAMLPLFEDFPECHVVVVGECLPADESYRQAMQSRLESAGFVSRVSFLGKQPFDRLPKLFQAMTVVAALSRKEGFGLTVLEAMASGVPVVTSEAGAWKDVVRQEVDGFVCPIGAVDEVSESLRFLLTDPACAQLMGQRARSRIEEDYLVENEARKITDYLLSLREPTESVDLGKS